MTTRRSFLTGIIGALAAPSIVRAESLMKLWVPPKGALTIEPGIWTSDAYVHPNEYVVARMQAWKEATEDFVKITRANGARPFVGHVISSPGVPPEIVREMNDFADQMNRKEFA